MNKFASLLLVVCLICVASCHKSPAPANTVFFWSGTEKLPEGWPAGASPFVAIWYTRSNGSSWYEYKKICSAKELGAVERGLWSPEIPGSIGSTWENRLTVFYFSRYFSSNLSAIDVPFDIVDRTFVGPRGVSEELGKVLADAPECDFSDTFLDPNVIQYQQEQERRDRLHKEAQLRGMIKQLKQEAATRENHDANTP